MTPPSGKVAARRSPGVVLVFGESINDARALSRLIEARCPALKGRVSPRPRPISLHRSASGLKVAKWVEQIRSAVQACPQTVACVFVHRDADKPDPHGKLEQSTNTQLRTAGINNGHAVVPVEEIEAWWLLFPMATEATRRSWSGTLKKEVRNVDSISDPKRELARRTGRNDVRKSYSEADSPAVAARVAEEIRAGKEPLGASASFNRFLIAVDGCCRSA